MDATVKKPPPSLCLPKQVLNTEMVQHDPCMSADRPSIFDVAMRYERSVGEGVFFGNVGVYRGSRNVFWVSSVCWM